MSQNGDITHIGDLKPDFFAPVFTAKDVGAIAGTGGVSTVLQAVKKSIVFYATNWTNALNCFGHEKPLWANWLLLSRQTPARRGGIKTMIAQFSVYLDSWIISQ